MKTITTTNALLLLLSLGLTDWPYAIVHAQGLFDFEREPINYHNRPANNVVTRLQSGIDSGKVELVFKEPRGYLDSILQYLKISKSTQSLVFSKSSAQLRKISPSRPRALYFNEQAYVGWVQDGEVIELIASDPTLGTVFYSLKQKNEAKPRLLRDKGQCLQCHAQRRTRDVPGPVVRSLYTGSDGQPILSFGDYVSDHTSPFSERWGGYYVTGTHGKMLHMGNLLTDRNQPPSEIDYSQGANLPDLSGRFDTRPYLSSHSDIVALMVLEHQSQMQNLITRALYEEVRGRSYDKARESTQDFPSDLSKRLVARAGNDLLQYMLCTGEFKLQSPVRGTSEFASQFSARGPRDRKGRSLYQLDLTTRLFKYPMSYMVYTESFRRLPSRVMIHIRRELHKVLTAGSAGDDYAHLNLKDRRAIFEILKDTCPELSDAW
ncbi:MAG: hypothetical protein MK102_09725 [Fuerstiella sp.]|nr:hypothetical protein [Fuerstiella sp.]